jgi:hypothetical protein
MGMPYPAKESSGRLKGNPRGEIKNGAAPAVAIGKQKRVELGVNRELFHMPNAV